jgi:hypothetical protein
VFGLGEFLPGGFLPEWKELPDFFPADDADFRRWVTAEAPLNSQLRKSKSTPHLDPLLGRGGEVVSGRWSVINGQFPRQMTQMFAEINGFCAKRRNLRVMDMEELITGF